MMRYLVLRQDRAGNVYDRPTRIDLDVSLPLSEATAIREVLARAFGSDEGPMDSKLHRALVFRLSDGEEPVAVPIKVEPPKWRTSDEWVTVQ